MDIEGEAVLEEHARRSPSARPSADGHAGDRPASAPEMVVEPHTEPSGPSPPDA